MTSQQNNLVKMLCQACSDFKISVDAFNATPFTENRMHQLGRFAELEARSECPLCQLIVQAYRNGPISEDSATHGNSRIQGKWTAINEGYSQTTSTPPGAFITIWLIRDNEDAKVELSIRHVQSEDDRSASNSLGLGRIIKNAWVDAGLVKKWMRACETNHNCVAKAPEVHRLHDQFMVIDVVNRCLIKHDHSSCRYFALSYVWGASVTFKLTSKAVEDLYKSNAFDNVWTQLSPTIRDAIEFTRKMGESYIWIDSLCIEQDNIVNLTANIGAMDLIYRCAALVLCAADDSAPTKGLPGVALTQRTINQCTSEVIPGLELLARFSHVTYMEHTIYRSRAWTYQEEQLSPRKLVFTNNQVYFTCSTYVYAEDIFEEGDSGPDLSLGTSYNMSRYIREDGAPSLMYFKSVQSYTLRQLSFPHDILNAFRGVEVMHCESLGSNSISGLPACIFDIALLWQPVGSSSRRFGFPSWSWAGWNGAVRWYGDTLELLSYGTFATPEQEKLMLTPWLRTYTWIVWYHISSTGVIEPVWHPLNDKETRSSYSPSLGDSRKQNIGYNSTAATSTNIYGRSISASAKLISDFQDQGPKTFQATTLVTDFPNNFHPLVFCTLTAKFCIQSSSAYLRYGSIDPVWEANGRTVFLLLNKNKQICGYVLLDESWNTQPHDVEYEFLMLSEANYFSNWGRPHENHPYRKFDGFDEYEEFHVMMVQWSTIGNGVRVAERVGIGRLLKDAIQDACGEGAQWKEIILV